MQLINYGGWLPLKATKAPSVIGVHMA